MCLGSQICFKKELGLFRLCSPYYQKIERERWKNWRSHFGDPSSVVESIVVLYFCPLKFFFTISVIQEHKCFDFKLKLKNWSRWINMGSHLELFPKWIPLDLMGKFWSKTKRWKTSFSWKQNLKSLNFDPFPNMYHRYV